jgi:hypothetical protein
MRRIAALTALFVACSGDAPRAETETGTETAAGAQAQAQAEPRPVTEDIEPTPVGEPAGAPITDLREIAFAPALEVNLDAMERQESGLFIQVLQEGEGPPAAPGDTMGVDYTVWFPDGTKLDSSHDHTPPAPYPMVLGETPLIAGWVEGVTGMRQGEERRLVLPYDLAYGASGRPGVPPYTPLVFEVELARLASGGGS